jgi:putative ABC transport system permease protein
VSYNNIRFREENLYFADAAFLTMFSLQMKNGDNSAALTSPNTIVLSQSAARKYFGAEDPVGKTINLNNRHFTQDLSVTAVFADLPANSHIKIDFLVSLPTLISASWQRKVKWLGQYRPLYVSFAGHPRPTLKLFKPNFRTLLKST